MSSKNAARGAPRRWPDLLIGVLVVALLTGFALLLLRPGPQTAVTPAPSPVAADPVIPTAPAPAPVPSEPTPAAPATAAPATAEPAAAEPAAPAPASAAPATAEPTTEVPVIPAAPIGQTPAEPEAPTAEAPAPTPATPAAAEPASPSPTARPGGAVATSEARVPLRSDYRISLGTFASEAAARERTSGVSALGYTVYPIDLGTQVVAQVGPFADEASARQALADVQRAYPGALLYPPRDRTLGGTAPGSAATAETPTPSATPAPAPSGPIYLQVGAFDRVESAQKLVQQLRDLGYAPSVNAPVGRKVAVLVGPYTGDALTRTEARLSANGLEHFRVR